MAARRRRARHAAIVIGSAEFASAIARALHRAGFATVMCDSVDPPAMRRGMSYVDAWFIGDAELEETPALFCSSARSIPTVLGSQDVIAATAWSWRGMCPLLDVAVLVDASNVAPGAQRHLVGAAGAALTIGANPWHVAGMTADVVIGPTANGRPAASKLAHALSFDPLQHHEHRQRVIAPANGRFATDRHIGEYVMGGELVAALGRTMLHAPASGVLSGLTARGAAVMAGAPVIEVDVRGQPAQCFTIPPSCRDVADAVARLALERVAPRSCEAVMMPSPPAPRMITSHDSIVREQA